MFAAKGQLAGRASIAFVSGTALYGDSNRATFSGEKESGDGASFDAAKLTRTPTEGERKEKTMRQRGIACTYGLSKTLHAIHNCRNIGKRDMPLNNFCPKIEVQKLR